MPSLSLHGSHFPPGYAIFLKLVALSVGDTNMGDVVTHIALYGWIIVFLGSTAVIPLYLMAKEIAGSEKAFLAAALFVVLPNSIIFGAVSMDAVFAAMSLWTIYFFVRAHGRAPAPNSLAAGFLLGITLFFSFSGFAVGLLLLIMSVIQAVRSRELFSRYVLICACIALGFLVNLVLAYVLLGYNCYETFIVARTSAQSLMQNVVLKISGKTLRQLYLYTLWGNLLAFLIYSGLSVVGIWWRRMFVRSNGKMTAHPERDFARATTVLVAILGSAGFYHMETERIWLFISAVIPATIASCLNNEERGSFSSPLAVVIFSGCALQALVFEVVFFTIW
jgi:asparagine N-glycosylation enzyme membrane subunit Stt3